MGFFWPQWRGKHYSKVFFYPIFVYWTIICWSPTMCQALLPRKRHSYPSAQGTYMPTISKGYTLQVLGLCFHLWRNKHKKCLNSLCACQRLQVGNKYVVCCGHFRWKRRSLTQDALKSPAPLRLWRPLRTNMALGMGHIVPSTTVIFLFLIFELCYYAETQVLAFFFQRTGSYRPKESISNAYYPREKI